MRDQVMALADEHGKENLTREWVCDQLGVSPVTLTNALGMSYTAFMATLPDSEVPTGGAKIRKRYNDKKHAKKRIIACALEAAKEVGYSNLTMKTPLLLELTDRTYQNIQGYVGTVSKLRKDVIRAAVKQGVVEVIAQGLAAKDKYVLQNVTDEMKERVAQYMRGV